MTNRKTTTTATATAYHVPTYTDHLYATADRAVYIALRARHEKAPTDLLTDLQNAQHTDSTARTAPQIAAHIAELETMHESHRQGYEVFNARANRLTLTDHERALAFTLATEFKTKADREQAEIADLYDLLGMTYTDRADLTQTAVLALLEVEQNPAPITATVLATYGVTDPDELNELDRATAQATANFRYVINAVGREIGNLAHPDALNSHTTKSRKATPDEVSAWLDRYGSTGKNVKVSAQIKRARASDCYLTMEYKDGKTAKGWYLVTHYVTIAPYQYIDLYTDSEDGETDPAYLKTYNPFVTDQDGIERIEELAERANLTDRERAFLTEYANRCRFDSNPQAVRAYAFDRIGITSRTAQDTFFHRLKSKLNK